MPIPLLVGGVALLTAAVGGKKAFDAHKKNSRAKRINNEAERIFNEAKDNLKKERDRAGKTLEGLGKDKVSILKEDVNPFIQSFRQIKNIDLKDSKGLQEIAQFSGCQDTLKDMEELGSLATKMVSGSAEGMVAGGLMAFGAYSAAGLFGAASTGTAIAGLSGVAATNATLAFLGGGSIAAGGLGIAGGTMVLGGLVAGPAIAVLGFMLNSKAEENLDKAKTNQAKAKEAEEAMNLATDGCKAVSERADMFRHLLSDLDDVFRPLIRKMDSVISERGTNFREYNQADKEVIAMALSTASAVKAVLDTPILTKDGSVTAESLEMYRKIEAFLPTVKA